MILLSPESLSPPSRFLIPPPVKLDRAELSELADILPRVDADTAYRPKPVTGKYIPPHQRGSNNAAPSKSKYVPPHHRQNHPFTPITPPIDTVQLDQLDIVDESATGFIRGGCADPQLIHGSILDQAYIPKRASRLEKTRAEAHGSYGGSFSSELSYAKKKSSKLRWEVGAISECGIRESQEDSYVLNNDLLKTFESGPYGSLPQSYWKQEETDHSLGLFAIFDGHCGNQGARFAVERLGRFIHDELLLVESNDSHHQQSDASSLHPSNIESILSEAFVKMDNEFCNLCQLDGREWESGACATVAIVANENLVVASLGDCRGILCRFVDDATSYESDNLWCQLDTELDDIVCGELAVSRALGDRDFKASFNSMLPSTQKSSDDHETTTTTTTTTEEEWESPLFLPYPDNHSHRFRGDLVTNTPDFHRVQLGTEGVVNEFLLLACDGLWDVMDADDAVRIVRDLLYHKKFTAKKAAARLAELAIHLGSSDNITVIVVRLISEK
ncbi:protein serine/threonine phosphatase 2C [Fragilariopsis cylindrus CCMP1102]|uniref:Protein serine/threonine phosphatase 2C n=1 Tax=Fragilariopsis cylindrus CCMP1102 TaxID=635003 RepID=A0A1E7ENC8_9STRA|nr:protein serine/threonine phosphatase 2C [Fragilariopsis cylindrus CCMP1102]|eukprot:OEU07458.1 protein serine/threonine phosphatase 2C [Fragilariopsis cylindrus CCMP1102]